MDFLYCHIKIEKDESQVTVAFKQSMWSVVNEVAILQWNVCNWMLGRMEMI